MRLLGQVIVLCLAIAALQAVLSLLVVAIVLLVIWGLLFRTRETVGLLLAGLFFSALQAHPVVTIALVCGLLGIKLMAVGRTVGGVAQRGKASEDRDSGNLEI